MDITEFYEDLEVILSYTRTTADNKKVVELNEEVIEVLEKYGVLDSPTG